MQKKHKTTAYASHVAKLVLGVFVLLAVSVPENAYAFFGDRESSEENLFGASSLGIALAVLDENDGFRETGVTADLEEDAVYRLTHTASGSFCSNANVVIKQNGSEVYSGALMSFTGTAASVLSASATDTWTFNFSPINGNGDAGECSVTWTYEANQLGYLHGEAFFDTETDTQMLSGTALGVIPAGPAPIAPLPTTNIVLNEVYANEDDTEPAPNEREWVELYNGTAAPIDVEGWQISEVQGSEVMHVISSANTCADGSKVGYARPYNGASTEIPVGGYLVIEFCSSSRLNNGGDTVTLYDLTPTAVDSYEYTSTVKGKSDARIPDGGDWEDPVPTPGMPNKPDKPSFTFRSEQEEAPASAEVPPAESVAEVSPDTEEDPPVEKHQDEKKSEETVPEAKPEDAPVEEAPPEPTT